MRGLPLISHRTVEAPILAPSSNPSLLRRTAEFAEIASELASRADDTGAVDPAVWSALHSTGLSIAPFDTAIGGSGLICPDQQTTLCSMLRLIGGADLSVARLFEGHFNAVLLVSRYGTADQISSLAHFVKGGGLSGVWGAEDAAGLERISCGQSWQLSGRKIFASGAGSVARPLITVTTPDGHLLYLLDFDDSRRVDHRSWKPHGMRATASGTVDLTGISVGPSEQIGSAGDFMRQPVFSGGAWRFCAAQLGAMERLVALYLEQLRSRGRDSDPYQLKRVASCATACTTTLFWVEEASRRFGDESLDAAAMVAFANLTRLVTERAALDVMECVQRGAGLGAFQRANPIERICRDLSTYLRQPVPDLAMIDAARSVLTGMLTIGSCR